MLTLSQSKNHDTQELAPLGRPGWKHTDREELVQRLHREKLQTHKPEKAISELDNYTGFSCHLEITMMMFWNFQLLLENGKKSQASLRVYICLEMHINFNFLPNSSPTWYILLLQTHRMVEVGRELWRSSWPTPLPKLFLQALAKIAQFDFQYWFLQKCASTPSYYSTCTYEKVSSTGMKYLHRKLPEEKTWFWKSLANTLFVGVNLSSITRDQTK